MPQLDPAPWFNILVLSWFIFISVLPLKVVSHTFPNDPSTLAADHLTSDVWAWPWF
uniref:ATP synthase complex subunit 8 n=1 Tax=Neopomacentrus cyanomos TaxID=196131 RepID=Q7YDQ9_9TELE|nr:ATP synthase 8 [Neopomacentrus cyanomos]